MRTLILALFFSFLVLPLSACNSGNDNSGSPQANDDIHDQSNPDNSDSDNSDSDNSDSDNSDSDNSDSAPHTLTQVIKVEFNDRDSNERQISGTLKLWLPEDDHSNTLYKIYWSDDQGNKLEDTPLASAEHTETPTTTISILANTLIPTNATRFLIVAANAENEMQEGFILEIMDWSEVVSIPQPKRLAFRDIDGKQKSLAGGVKVTRATHDQDLEGYRVFWGDENGDPLINLGELARAQLSEEESRNGSREIEIPIAEPIAIPAEAHYLLATGFNSNETEVKGPVFKFVDFIGDIDASGPGGNIKAGYHYYGKGLPFLSVSKDEQECVMDNGYVMLIDMNNQDDPRSQPGNDSANIVDDNTYPAFRFGCDELNNDAPVNNYREVNTAASPINDAMFFATETYNMFIDYLGVRPLKEEKVRVRAHYGSGYDNASWDGAYVDLGDGRNYFYPMAVLDVVAHEIAHGFTEAHSKLKIGSQAGALNEGFSDITGETLEYYIKGQVNWVHNYDAWKDDHFGLRYFHKPSIKSGINSYRDYRKGMSIYHASGILSHSFFLLVNPLEEYEQHFSWSIPNAFRVIAFANQFCWKTDEEFPSAAACILEQSSRMVSYFEPICETQPEHTICQETKDKVESDLYSVFAQVDLNVEPQHGLHPSFKYDTFLLETTFTSTSYSAEAQDIEIVEWHFGDGKTSTEDSPVHIFAEEGDYRVSLRVRDKQGKEALFSRKVSVAEDYCSPNPVSSRFWISTVSINGIQMHSAGDGYRIWEDKTLPLPQDRQLELRLTSHTLPEFEDENRFWNIWIDTNSNGKFDDEEVYGRIQGQGTLEHTITLPEQSYNKSLRLRIFMSRTSHKDKPCARTMTGEAEDFILNLHPSEITPEAGFKTSNKFLKLDIFNTSATYDNTRFVWHFGDGEIYEGPHPINYEYKDAGEYQIRLQIFDNDDKLLDEHDETIHIEAPPASGGYCTAFSEETNFERISEVKVGEQSHTSNDASGYNDFSSTLFEVAKDSDNHYPIALTLSPWINPDEGSDKENWQVWIDLNGDKVFSENELVLQKASTEPFTETVNISADQINVEATRMRVILRFRNPPTDDACQIIAPPADGGQIEDYTIKFL